MDNTRQREIINTAKEERSRHNIGAVVPIGDIVEFCQTYYGCTINLIEFSKQSMDEKYHNLDALARINPKTNKLEILINQDMHHSMNKIRFTIAHELGHYILGHFTKNNVLARGDSINLFDTKNEEEEANLFAAEFLLPQMAIEGNIDIISISKYFKVSQQVVQYRKANSERN